MSGGRISHVVVLMLENRSFDHMLGFLDHPDPSYPRLAVDQYQCPVNPADPTSPRHGVTDDAEPALRLDPPHSHNSIMEQLNPNPLGAARMNGFISAYERKAAGGEDRPIVHWLRIEIAALALAALLAVVPGVFVGSWFPVWWAVTFGVLGVVATGIVLWARRAVGSPGVVSGVGADIMKCMAPNRIPVLGELARQFAVCTRWHSSVPGETWPNRNFLHSGTSDGTVDIELGFYDNPTVFEQLAQAGKRWSVYTQGRAHLWAFKNLWHGDAVANWYDFSDFADHVARDELAEYCFIEPKHDGSGSNSQHPGNNEPAKSNGDDFRAGETLVARIYEALRAKPEVFAKTLFLVTYDEHGGLFDHVPPPAAVAPTPTNTRRVHWVRRVVAWFIERSPVTFDFRRLGVRVPTIIVSPWIEPGTVDDRTYDHSSVIATLRKVFAPGSPPLTGRDGAANTFEDLVAGRTEPRADLPDLSARATAAAQSEAAAGLVVRQDDFAEQLTEIAALMRSELGAGLVAGPEAVGASGQQAGGEPDGDVVAAFSALAAGSRGSG